MKLQSHYHSTTIFCALSIFYICLPYLTIAFMPAGNVSSLWIPAGVALVGCSIYGNKFLPTIFVGVFIFNTNSQVWLEIRWDWSVIAASALMALGSCMQAWLNYKLLQFREINILNAPSYFQVSFFIFVAALSCLVTAAITNGMVTLIDNEAQSTYIQLDNIMKWSIGNFLGIILITPMLLSLLCDNPNQTSKATLVKSFWLPSIAIILLLQYSQQYIEEEIAFDTDSEFELKAKVTEKNLKQHMDEYLDALNQLSAYLSRQNNISKEDFHDVTGPLIRTLSGIKAMSWNPVISQEDLATFELDSQRSISDDFQVKGEPLLPSDPAVVVALIEPLSKNNKALGFNVFSNLERKQSMLLAKSSQTATATDIIQLVQSDKKEPGFLIFAPVFKSVSIDNATLVNHQYLSGFAVGVFVVAEIIKESLDYDLYVYENNDPEAQVYGNEEIMSLLLSADGLSHTFNVDFANHTWTFNLHIDSQVVALLQAQKLFYFFIVKVIFGALSVFIILSAFGRHENLRRLVNTRTAELEAVNLDLEQYAFYDSLTKLPNRRLFIDRAEHALTRAKREGYKVALLFMDLNRFKQVNDSLGHKFGDLLLTEVASRFSDTLRNSDTLARVGGDEFTVLVENNPSKADINTIVKKLAESLDLPVKLDGKSLYTSTSIGIAIYPQDGDSVNDLLRGADAAMYQAKQSAVVSCFYSQELRDKASEQLYLESELSQVLQKNQLKLLFQPIMQLEPLKHLACECLLRWQHPTKGLLLPAQFIPAAELSGKTIPIGYWMIEQVCKKIALWNKAGIIFNHIAVNVSAKQLQHELFVYTVKDIIQRRGIKPQQLQLEVAEGALAQNVDLSISTLKQLKSFGVILAIGDYGTGHSSLNYLKQLPVDVLKINHMFVENMHYGDQDHAIIKSTVYLAKELGITLVIEGIETTEQLAILQGIFCQVGQGNLFSQALEENDYLEFSRVWGNHVRLQKNAV